LFKVDALNSYYGDIQVLYNVNLYIDEGHVVAVVGANAAGKSTLINSISGLVEHKTGKIYFKDQRIDGLPAHRIAELGVIQIPEGRRIFPFLTVLENLELGCYSKWIRSRRKNNLQVVFDLLPILKERQNQMAGSLSGGEQQMCAIGRALMAMPKVLMLDEPTLGLAPLLVQKIFELLKEIKARNTTILLVEQNVRKSLSIADRGYVLENGQIVLEGKGEDLLSDERLREAYIGGGKGDL